MPDHPEDFAFLLSTAIADGLVPPSIRGCWETVHRQDPEFAARTLTEIIDAVTGQAVGAEPESSTQVANPVLGFSSPEAAAQAFGVRLQAIGQVAQIDRDIEAAAAPPEPPATAAEWLDTRPLTTPPRPWSQDDFERDVRRAEAAELSLDRDTWQLYAELGKDAVASLWADRQEAQVGELMDWRQRFIEHEQGKVHDEQRAVRERVEDDAKDAAVERTNREARREAIAATRHIGFVHPLDRG